MQTQYTPANRPALSGPSGKTQVPLVQATTGARLSVTAAQSPALSPNNSLVRLNISQVAAANSKINGARTARGASVPKKFAPAHASHQASGG
jgi:hypothetical protein